MQILSFVLFIMATISIFLIGTIRHPTSTSVLEADDHSNKKILATESEAIDHYLYDENDVSKNRPSDIVQRQEVMP